MLSPHSIAADKPRPRYTSPAEADAPAVPVKTDASDVASFAWKCAQREAEQIRKWRRKDYVPEIFLQHPDWSC